MNDTPNYDINLDEKFGPLEVIDLPALAGAVTHPWFNQTLCRVNDCVTRVGVFQKGEFHWHKHDDEDEFFFVLEGEFEIDIENGETVALGQHVGYTIPRGVVHRTRVPESAVVLMIEGAGVQPTGDE
jgi:mannose-6-phosphate isomerase-like protein (cupin superfamily)